MMCRSDVSEQRLANAPVNTRFLGKTTGRRPKVAASPTGTPPNAAAASAYAQLRAHRTGLWGRAGGRCLGCPGCWACWRCGLCGGAMRSSGGGCVGGGAGRGWEAPDCAARSARVRLECARARASARQRRRLRVRQHLRQRVRTQVVDLLRVLEKVGLAHAGDVAPQQPHPQATQQHQVDTQHRPPQLHAASLVAGG